MMGRAHAASGAAGWLAACAGLAVLEQPVTMSTVVVGAAVSAGAALVPDIDHPSSTVARTIGPITQLLARGFSRLAAGVRMASCDHCERRPSRGGHRALSHTAVFAVVLGGLVSLAGLAFGAHVLWVVVAAVGLAARGLLSRRRRGTFGAVLLGGMVAGAMAVTVPPGYGWWWLGVPVAWGCFAHCLGDALTYSRCPVLWPLRIGGCRWRELGPPDWMRFRAGGAVERLIVMPLIVLACIGSSWALVMV